MTDTTADSSDPAARPGPSRPSPAGPPQMTHRQIMMVLSALGLGMLLAALDQTIVSTALWTIVKDIGGPSGLAHMPWVVTAYLLTSTATMPLYGKVSDLYGRKPVYMFAISMFLVGSALAGLSQNLWQLVATRAIQGMGAGGLMTLAFAIVADVVSPRERGRYQGWFGAVFALASVVGPLLGGFFTDQHRLFGIHTDWRWVFYINLPLGLLALVVTSLVLHTPHQRREHHIDVLGAVLMVAGVSSLLLGGAWGGQEYPWGSPVIIGLAATGVLLVAAFLWHEARESEPILPLSLFRNRVFSVGNGIGFVVGFALFGGIVFLPLYLQVVDGASPTAAGLRLMPLMFGIISASILSGRLLSSLGRYKLFPIIGTAVAAVGMALLATVEPDTPAVVLGGYMFLFGAGIGLVLQVLVVAVQNAVPPREVGVATSAATFFRAMGGSFGTALFGAILAHQMATGLPRGAGPSGPPNPAQLKLLSPALQQRVVEVFVNAVHVVFACASGLIAFAFVVSFFLKELPLRGSVAPHLEETAPAPADRAATETDRAATETDRAAADNLRA